MVENSYTCRQVRVKRRLIDVSIDFYDRDIHDCDYFSRHRAYYTHKYNDNNK